MKNENINIDSITPLLSPEWVKHKLTVSDAISAHVSKCRKEISDVIQGRDKRLLVIVGPCSIHDEVAALDYARQLKILADKYADKLVVVMRVYFEKPRTNIGWKGLINDPNLDDSYAINEGIQLARKILLDINAIGLSTATEFVDTITPQYLADLVSWAAIGARTTESQPHRMLASGLSMPVGFKNNTAGDIGAAVNAVLAAANPHRFLSVTAQGLGAIVATKGNADCHVVLRGGSQGINYSAYHLNQAATLLSCNGLATKVIVDCSHDNCGKNHKKQAKVVDYLSQQLRRVDHNIMGIMLESNLVEGKQPLGSQDKLTYGQSITDGCINLVETERLLDQLALSCNVENYHECTA